MRQKVVAKLVNNVCMQFPVKTGPATPDAMDRHGKWNNPMRSRGELARVFNCIILFFT